MATPFLIIQISSEERNILDEGKVLLNSQLLRSKASY